MFTASGTGAFESAIVNLLSPGERVLAVSQGEFGQRWQSMARAFGCDVVPLAYEWGESPRPDDLPKPEEWKTPPLWGVADSAPYFHDGHSPTLQAAILRHRGDAKAVTERFKGLPADDQASLVAFLRTLKAPPDAPTVRDPSVTRLVKR